MENYAFIPARKGSIGFKYKNRLFFDNTADFIDKIEWFEKVIVSTDDEEIIEKADERNYTSHFRSQELSGPDVSIKSVLENVFRDAHLSNDVYVWLFYLPIIYKKMSDYVEAKRILDKIRPGSLCTFIPARTHPYNCWKYDDKKMGLEQFIPNDVFRRQDLQEAWMHYHYIYVCRISEIINLNSELLNSKTYPIFIEFSEGLRY